VRSLARLLLLGGAIAIGWYLFGSAPREVTLLYGLPAGSGPGVLEVDLLEGGQLVRHAALKVDEGQASLSHPVRLRDGSYRLRLRLQGRSGPAREMDLPLVVTESGPVVLPLGGLATAH
jgi:hypothetical protein